MRCIAIALLCACGSKPAAVTPSATPPALADLAWLEGAWHDRALDERWLGVETALWGVALHDGGYEVNVIDDSDDDGKPQPVALVTIDGKTEEHFAFHAALPQAIDFAADGRAVRFARTGDTLHGTFVQPPQPAVELAVTATRPSSAPDLEAADLQFGKDTAERGADGWTAWFGEHGMMWRRGQPVTGAEAIHAAIARTLAKGMLVWRPVASGTRGDWGFTLGTWTFHAAHGSYCTIWHREGAAWKVAFDVGRPANGA